MVSFEQPGPVDFVSTVRLKKIPQLTTSLSYCGFEQLNLYFVHIRPRGYKTFFLLNSVEHEILNAHKYRNIKKFGFF